MVLVTGMVPRENEELVGVLKLPLGSDGFFNEIHPKLRPVETVVDGVLIAGACQGPKTSAESVASGLAAVTQSAAVLKKGYTELDPLVAIVVPGRVHRVRRSASRRCPYDAIAMTDVDGRAVGVDQRGRLQGLRRLRAGLPGGRDRPARLHRRADHGDDREPAGGGRSHEHARSRDIREIVREEPVMRGRDPRGARRTARSPSPRSRTAIGAPAHEVVFWVMGMRRYGWLGEIKGNTMRRLLPVPTAVPEERPAMTATASTSACIAEIRRFGAADMSACFNCGTCTAICPLSENDGDVPAADDPLRPAGHEGRAALEQGAVDLLPAAASAPRRCPTQADPAEFMAAARRYAIASYDGTGHRPRRCTPGPIVGTVIAVALAALLRPVHVHGARAAGPRIPRHLRVHPVGADPQPRASS